MVSAKTELFDDDLTLKANLFKALAHPARLYILKLLAESETCITGDISDALPLGRTTVNQHLKELKEMGLIKGEIDGIKTKYCLDNCKIDNAKALIDDFFKIISLNKNLEC